jgi:hypothetical protein
MAQSVGGLNRVGVEELHRSTGCVGWTSSPRLQPFALIPMFEEERHQQKGGPRPPADRWMAAGRADQYPK